MKKTILVSLLLLATSLLVACGDDDEDSSTSEAETITLSEWRTQADEICADSDARIEEEAGAIFGGGRPSDEEIQEFAASTVVPELQEQHDAIADLPAPDEEAEQASETLSALQQGIDEIEADPAIVTQGENGAPGLAEASRLARDLGLEDCGS